MSLSIVAGKELVIPAEKLQLLKDTICKGCQSNQEFELFLMIANRSGLDPFAKQIYAVFRWDSKLGRNVMTAQTSIDGYRLTADRTGNYSPGREPEFSYDKDGKLIKATAFVKKMTRDGIWHEVSASAYYSEYVGKKKDGTATEFWASKPHTMLAKCAECLAIKKCFPAELLGLYAKEEMEQADNPVLDITPEVVESKEITQEQATELVGLIKACSEEEKKEHWKTIQKVTNPPIKKMEELPVHLYEVVKRRAEKKLKEMAEGPKGEANE